MSVENHCRFPATLPVMRDPGILSFMSAVAFAEGEVKSPEGIDPAPVDKPVVSPQTGIGGNLYLIGALALTVCAADAALLKKISA